VIKKQFRSMSYIRVYVKFQYSFKIRGTIILNEINYTDATLIIVYVNMLISSSHYPRVKVCPKYGI
jgi:hypothetical protein